MTDRVPSAIPRAEIGDTARVLKMWRELAGVDQRVLALLAGLHHYTTISDYETGKTVPEAETVARVSAALGMTATDREEAESFVRRIYPKLQATALAESDLPGLPSLPGEFAALGKQIAHTAPGGVLARPPAGRPARRSPHPYRREDRGEVRSGQAGRLNELVEVALVER